MKRRSKGHRAEAAANDPDFLLKPLTHEDEVQAALDDLQCALIDFGRSPIALERIVYVRRFLGEAASAIGQALVTAALLESDLRDAARGREAAWEAYLRLGGSDGLLRKRP